MKRKKNQDERSARAYAIPPALSAPCIELSGNRELLIEGSKGVLEYSTELIRVNTVGIVITVSGRGLNLRCISESALVIDGFITSLAFDA